MKINITLNATESRAIENVVNKYAPITEQNLAKFENDTHECRFGQFELTNNDGRVELTTNLVPEFVVDVIGLIDNVINPIIGFAKTFAWSLKSMVKEFNEKWTDKNDEWNNIAKRISKDCYQNRTFYILGLTKSKTWTAVNETTQKLTDVFSHSMVESADDIDILYNNAKSNGNECRFMLFKDGEYRIADLEETKKFFEDNKIYF